MAAARKSKSYDRIVELVEKIHIPMKTAQSSIIINVEIEIEREVIPIVRSTARKDGTIM